MNRRQFTGALAGIAAAQTARPAAKEDAHWFLVETFQLRQGDQVARMHDVLKGWLSKTPAGPKLVLEAVIAPHSPQLVAILGVANFEDIRTAHTAMTMAQTGLGMGEPPFDALNTTVLEATAYSPEIVIKKSETPRYFELRTYHSPTMAQLIALHQRFAGPEQRVFHRSGIFPLFYSSTVIGAMYWVRSDMVAPKPLTFRSAFMSSPSRRASENPRRHDLVFVSPAAWRSSMCGSSLAIRPPWPAP